MSKVPGHVFNTLRTILWEKADEIDWLTLSDSEKSRAYEQWTDDNEVGGVLNRYMDRGSVRVYLKDTIMKPYAINRLNDPPRIMRYVGVDETLPAAKDYIKPLGRRLSDGRVVCWGPARNWKAILFAVYERAYGVSCAEPHCAVLIHPTGRMRAKPYTEMVNNAGERLGIERVVFIYD